MWRKTFYYQALRVEHMSQAEPARAFSPHRSQLGMGITPKAAGQGKQTQIQDYLGADWFFLWTTCSNDVNLKLSASSIPNLNRKSTWGRKSLGRLPGAEVEPLNKSHLKLTYLRTSNYFRQYTFFSKLDFLSLATKRILINTMIFHKLTHVFFSVLCIS